MHQVCAFLFQNHNTRLSWLVDAHAAKYRSRSWSRTPRRSLRSLAAVAEAPSRCRRARTASRMATNPTWTVEGFAASVDRERRAKKQPTAKRQVAAKANAAAAQEHPVRQEIRASKSSVTILHPKTAATGSQASRACHSLRNSRCARAVPRLVCEAFVHTLCKLEMAHHIRLPCVVHLGMLHMPVQRTTQT